MKSKWINTKHKEKQNVYTSIMNTSLIVAYNFYNLLLLLLELLELLPTQAHIKLSNGKILIQP